MGDGSTKRGSCPIEPNLHPFSMNYFTKSAYSHYSAISSTTGGTLAFTQYTPTLNDRQDICHHKVSGHHEHNHHGRATVSGTCIDPPNYLVYPETLKY